MGTEVLRPHDLLIDGFLDSRTAFQRRSGLSMGNKKASKPDKKKINFSPENLARKKAKKGIVVVEGRKKVESLMGKVTLLKRGESLDSFTAKIKSGSQQPETVADVAVLIPETGPDFPELFPKQIRLTVQPIQDTYAGSAFYISPSPRSVPLPSFFNSKRDQMKPFTDSATEDLRRLLRLE